MRSSRWITLGLVGALMMAMAVPAGAGSPWEDVAIEPGDSTECEFEPNAFTEYRVDEGTLPQFDRMFITQHEMPNRTFRAHFKLERNGIPFLKLNPDAPGPDVMIETQHANVRIVVAADGEMLSLNGSVVVDRAEPRWRDHRP